MTTRSHHIEERVTSNEGKAKMGSVPETTKKRQRHYYTQIDKRAILNPNFKQPDKRKNAGAKKKGKFRQNRYMQNPLLKTVSTKRSMAKAVRDGCTVVEKAKQETGERHLSQKKGEVGAKFSSIGHPSVNSLKEASPKKKTTKKRLTKKQNWGGEKQVAHFQKKNRL